MIKEDYNKKALMNTDNQWDVKAVRMGYFPGMKYSQIVKLGEGEQDRIVDVPAWTVLARRKGVNVLVDLGICNPVIGSIIFECRRDAGDEQAEALKIAAGIAPEDIDYVIFTHLHWDHVGDSLRPFRKARFVVQRAQWDFMHECDDDQEIFYHLSRIICADKSIPEARWMFVSGGAELLAGITLVPTPGHSPGHQSIRINTAHDKTLLVLGDAANTRYNVESKVLSGVYHDEKAYIDSLNLIESLADCVIGGHEISGISPFQDNGFPEIKKKNKETTNENRKH